MQILVCAIFGIFIALAGYAMGNTYGIPASLGIGLLTLLAWMLAD